MADATARQKNKDKHGVVNQKYSEHRDITAQFLGLLGEWSVAEYFGVDYDRNLYIGGDGHLGDVELPDGRRIDCKMRGRRGWDYALNGMDWEDELKAPLCGLVWPAERGYTNIVGYITREEFDEHKIINDFGHGPRWVVEWEKFRHIGHLLKEVADNVRSADRQVA